MHQSNTKHINGRHNSTTKTGKHKAHTRINTTYIKKRTNTNDKYNQN